MRLEMKSPLFNTIIHDYFDSAPVLKKSRVYEVLELMPKGAIHHVHLAAAPCLEWYVKLTYNEHVYLNEREKLFKVVVNSSDVEEGYMQCTEMRKFWKTGE